MNKKEIKEYLKRVDELGTKLTGKDKETYAWLIYGYNQCAKLLNETEQQLKKQLEEINKMIEKIKILIDDINTEYVANDKGEKLSYSKSDLMFADRINELIDEVNKLKGEK